MPGLARAVQASHKLAGLILPYTRIADWGCAVPRRSSKAWCRSAMPVQTRHVPFRKSTSQC